MAARRKYFKCEICGIETSSTVPNYYKQQKKYGIHRCEKCGEKAGINSTKEKYKNNINNKSLVKVICPICKKERLISVRSAKNTTICISCSTKNAYLNGKYKPFNKRNIDINKFKESISEGLLKRDPKIRSLASKKSANYWNDPEKKESALKKRNTAEYRKKLQKIWENKEFKEKMSKISSDRLKQLWDTKEFKEKMALTRSKQPKQSKQQNILYSILDDLKINYTKEHAIGPWTFDCFLTDYNILIEVQGDYWHSLPKAIRSDKSKATYISEYYNHLKLIYFFENEFYQYSTVLNRLKYEIGLHKLEQINFNFKDINLKLEKAEIINEFMYKYHYLGPKNHSINLAYYLDNTLIACCCFSPIVRKEIATRLKINNKHIKEISRFAINPQYQKKNFASWLISKSILWIKNNIKDCKLIIAFSDNTIGHKGTIYKASNFKFDGYTEKSYYYTSKDGYVMHKKTLYNRAIKMSMTEKEFAEYYNYKKHKTSEKSRYLYYIS